MATSSAALPSTRRRSRLPRWVLLVGVLLVVLLAVFWFWGRNSSLVAVTDVKVTGATGSSAPEIERVIRGAAHGMTTLNFDPQVVRAALAAYPVVASVDIRTSFPHGAAVTVHQRTPVGTVAFGGKDVPVAKDGTLLLGTTATGVPPIATERAPVGGQVTDPEALAEVRVLAGATAAQRRQITRVSIGDRGVEVQLSGLPLAYFGDGDVPRDQWVALKRVLADPASAGATYIDVTVAERPAAGGFGSQSVTDGTDGGVGADTTGDAPADSGDGSLDGSSDTGATG